MKQIIFIRLFEFGGSNSHLKALVKYWGKDNILLVLENRDQLAFLKEIDPEYDFDVKIKPGLRKYAHLTYPSTLSNIKESLSVFESVLGLIFLSLKYGLAGITVCAVEPEKYLYFFWLPFIKVTYILHTSPAGRHTNFTSYTCNKRLGRRKKIITVSRSNAALIQQHWDIAPRKREYIYVVYNCVNENGPQDHSEKNDARERQHILTLGHVIGYKNPGTWLEVARSVTAVRENVFFIWLGNGPLWNDFIELTRDQDRIIFKGAVNDPHQYLADGAIYYQPSLHETHGIAVLEAMYHALPCVVSDVGGLPESIEDNFNGFLVSPLDVNEQTSVIIRLLDDLPLRKAIGENARASYDDRFSFNAFTGSMDAVMKNR